jgi:tRNA (uracil-5-)-methyltransferase TRM9
MSYDNFATTFSNSRKNHPWPELDVIIEDIHSEWYTSVLDIGCGNGRFLENYESRVSSHEFLYLGLDSSEWMIAEARKIHPEFDFAVCPMELISTHPSILLSRYSAIIFLASFHHLETRESRIQTLEEAKKLLAPNGSIYMTNWNLRDQPRYETSHRGNGDYDIKIGEFSRYYHGFTLEELAWLFTETGYHIITHELSPSGRNIYSKLQL